MSTTLSRAQQVEPEFKDSDKQKSVEWFLATIMTNQIVYRGALISKDPFYFPGVALTFYNKFRLMGPRFEYFKRIKNMQFTAGLRYFSNDSPPGFSSSASEDELFRFQRPNSIDVYVAFRYRFANRVQVSQEFHQDIIKHNGLYSYTSLLIPLLPFTSIGVGQGLGDARANRYAYGPEAKSGRAHHDFLVSVFIPFLPLNGILIARYTQPFISQDSNRDATYILREDRPKQLSLIATWKL